MIQNQMSPKDHLLESLNPFLIDMAQTTMPEISGVQVIRFQPFFIYVIYRC